MWLDRHQLTVPEVDDTLGIPHRLGHCLRRGDPSSPVLGRRRLVPRHMVEALHRGDRPAQHHERGLRSNALEPPLTVRADAQSCSKFVPKEITPPWAASVKS